ncbi:hypothetical protein I79_026194 [Cricetulus griseus]|uniref:Uncharacterized protein n=1 Tax=Cricetulus griseus TaxID=10029 RepID=G3IQ92_CRIGR|nr:hypothetical protein I79_026194 [Cricetulus griseus]
MGENLGPPHDLGQTYKHRHRQLSPATCYNHRKEKISIPQGMFDRLYSEEQNMKHMLFLEKNSSKKKSQSEI